MKKFELFTITILVSFLLLLSTSFAQGWEVQTSNSNQQLKGLYVIDQSEAWACGDAGVVLHTVDAGTSWNANVITGADLHSIVFRSATTGIVVGDAGIIFRTEDGGANWTSVTSSTGSQLRAGSWGNGDLTWSAMNSGTTARFRGIAAFGLDRAWAVGESGIIKFTSDGGATWVTQNSTTVDDLHDVQFLSETTGFAGGSGSKIIYTNDGGQTWISRSTGIAMGINGIFFLDENNGWAVSDAGTIYNTSNGGMTWALEQSNTTSILNEVFFVSLNAGWVVGDAGTVVYYNGAVTGLENQEGLLKSYHLFQNYPNPFNPTTTIKFELSEESFVTLKIYDVIGNEIATLVNERLKAGLYETSFEGVNVNSGVYFYSLHTENFVQTKKMTLLK
jgi:photosystem II stability/assembly factor-like uncharacterized protein